ncbi:hypothetical protein IscW_ISCW017958, partial [Ixodes scapularis]
MSVVPVLSVPSIEYEKFEMETAAKLWKVVDKVNEPAATGGAYRALAAFSTSCHTLKVLPDADVPLDANDWYRSFLVPSAWCLFMERAFRAAEESRRAELEYLRSHGKLPGTAEEVAARLGTCWLWY